MVVTTAISLTSILFAWFNSSSSMDMAMDTLHMHMNGRMNPLVQSPQLTSFAVKASPLSGTTNTTVSFPFVDSTACRQSLQAACRIHYPLTVVYGETGMDQALHDDNNNVNVNVNTDNHSNNNIHDRDFYMVTQKGFKEGPNQDRSFLLSPLKLSLHSQSSDTKSMDQRSAKNNNMLMVGLFDGHAAEGHITAEAAIDDMPRRLLANLELAEREQELLRSKHPQSPPSLDYPHYPSPAVVQQVLETTFLQVDQDSRIQQVPSGGATAVVVLQMGPTIYLASAGDSTGFVARYRKEDSSSGSSSKGEVVIVSTARRHKPADPDEHARIVAHGGTVIMPPGYDQPGQTSRVVVGTMGLAMSRCLGDLGGKPSGILTAQPTVRTLNLLDYHVEEKDAATGTGTSTVGSSYSHNADNDDQFFVVVASDGVVDFMSIQHVAEQVAASLYETSTSGSPSLAQTCRALIYESSLLWHTALQGNYRDDMTLVVSKLLKPLNQSGDGAIIEIVEIKSKLTL
jgi:serine/threonine protein phosphatase PrpC